MLDTLPEIIERLRAGIMIKSGEQNGVLIAAIAIGMPPAEYDGL